MSVPSRRSVFLAPVIAAFVQVSVLNAYGETSAAGLLPLETKQELLIASKASEPWIGSIKAYGEAATKAGDPVTVTMMEDSGHFDGLNPKAAAWNTVLASIRSIIGPK